MNEAISAGIFLLMLVASTAAGMLIRRALSERHSSHESMEVVRVVMTMLVTFASLVMGLLTVSVKNSFEAANSDMGVLASEIVRLDRLLREYGPETDPVRGLLRSYNATVITSTWPDEPKPAGDFSLKDIPPTQGGAMESKDLGDVLGQIGYAIRHLDPQDNFHRLVLSDSRNRFEALIQARWQVIDQARPIISQPFYMVLVFWLMVIFGCFGLTAPRNVFVLAIISLSAISIASAVFVILDLDTPFGGFFMISSDSMRGALADLTQ